MKIILNGESVLAGVPPEKVTLIENEIIVTAFKGGMKSGSPSVAFIFDIDGKKVMAQTSMKLFLDAAVAFATYFGDGRHRHMIIDLAGGKK